MFSFFGILFLIDTMISDRNYMVIISLNYNIADIRQPKRTNELQEIILNLNTKNTKIYIF